MELKSLSGFPLPKNQERNSLSPKIQTMAAVVEDIEVGFEEAMSWLPSHVLDEAVWDTKKNRVLNLALFIDVFTAKSSFFSVVSLKQSAD